MRVILCYSGGMDSTVLLYYLRKECSEIKALSVNYGQKHLKELEAASAITKSLGVEHQSVDLSSVKPLLSGSALTDSKVKVPHGHYEAESMKSTVVPNRNMIFLSIAAAWSISSKFDGIALSVHGGDHAIYPDCRKEFIDSMKEALRVSDWNAQHLNLMAPFLEIKKTDICRIGAELGVPFEKTWSCYEGGVIHCGECGTCIERKEAFREAQIIDPTKYSG